ncbi:hypothetical protein F383_09297 [Gossypium arboreum]|uniref:Uncharacterized protein n=1 Tax=Gossypium arboreum TaxID=29729 RepID=A0A0B0NY88_GOSAR|nr:hypothetical protein F383_09297 [Gossypium arboreum]
MFRVNQRAGGFESTL